MNEPASSASVESIVPANDSDPELPAFRMVVRGAEMHVTGFTVLRHDTDRLPEYWDGDFDRLDLMPIPESCIGQYVFAAFKAELNLTANFRPFLLNADLPARLKGKDLLLLGTLFSVGKIFSNNTQRNHVFGLKTHNGAQAWNLRGGDRLHAVAHALVFKA